MNECKQFLNFRFFKNGRSATSPWSSVLAKYRLLPVALTLLLGLTACEQNDSADGNAQASAANATTPAQASAAMAQKPLQSATRSQDRRQLTDFALQNHLGENVNRSHLQGQWSLLFFGFTRCPDICPPTLSQLMAIQRRLATRDDLPSEPLQTVFISVDTEYDQAQVINEYLDNFRDPDSETHLLMGLTGDPRQVKALAVQLGVAYEVSHDHSHHQHGDRAMDAEPGTTNASANNSATNSTGDADVSHSGAVILLDPDARIHAIFPPPLAPAAAMYDDLVELLHPAASQ